MDLEDICVKLNKRCKNRLNESYILWTPDKLMNISEKHTEKEYTCYGKTLCSSCSKIFKRYGKIIITLRQLTRQSNDLSKQMHILISTCETEYKQLNSQIAYLTEQINIISSQHETLNLEYITLKKCMSHFSEQMTLILTETSSLESMKNQISQLSDQITITVENCKTSKVDSGSHQISPLMEKYDTSTLNTAFHNQKSSNDIQSIKNELYEKYDTLSKHYTDQINFLTEQITTLMTKNEMIELEQIHLKQHMDQITKRTSYYV